MLDSFTRAAVHRDYTTEYGNTEIPFLALITVKGREKSHTHKHNPLFLLTSHV